MVCPRPPPATPNESPADSGMVPTVATRAATNGRRFSILIASSSLPALAPLSLVVPHGEGSRRHGASTTPDSGRQRACRPAEPIEDIAETKPRTPATRYRCREWMSALAGSPLGDHRRGDGLSVGQAGDLGDLSRVDQEVLSEPLDPFGELWTRCDRVDASSCSSALRLRSHAAPARTLGRERGPGGPNGRSDCRSLHGHATLSPSTGLLLPSGTLQPDRARSPRQPTRSPRRDLRPARRYTLSSKALMAVSSARRRRALRTGHRCRCTPATVPK